MGVPTSEVGYTSAIPRREDHEVHKDKWGHWGEGEKKPYFNLRSPNRNKLIFSNRHKKAPENEPHFLMTKAPPGNKTGI